MSEYTHLRWFNGHMVQIKPGSEYVTRWGQHEAVCAACGEAVVRLGGNEAEDDR